MGRKLGFSYSLIWQRLNDARHLSPLEAVSVPRRARIRKIRAALIEEKRP
jgi:hypothetical protein